MSPMSTPCLADIRCAIKCTRLLLCRKQPSRKGKLDARHLLPSERAALSQASLATGGLAKHSCAALADDDGLGVGENGGDGEAAGALDVHEEGAGSRHKSLFVILVSKMQMVSGGW